MENPTPGPVQPDPQPVPPPPAASPEPPKPDMSQLSQQVYPSVVSGPPPAAASQPSPNDQPGAHIVTNPFTNMVNGFVKFLKTNFLLAVVYSFLFLGIIFAAQLALIPALSIDHNGTNFFIYFIIELIIVGILSSALLLVDANLLVQSTRGHKVKFLQAMQPLKKIWIPIVYMIVYGLLVVGAFVGIFASLSGGASGGLVALLYFIILIVFVYLALKWSFTAFTIVDYPDSGPLNSLKRSSELSKGHKFTIFLYWLLFAIASLIADALTGGLRHSQPTYNYNGYNAGTSYSSSTANSGRETVLGIITLILSLLIFCAFAELYRQIKDSREPQDNPQPAPPVTQAGA